MKPSLAISRKKNGSNKAVLSVAKCFKLCYPTYQSLASAEIQGNTLGIWVRISVYYFFFLSMLGLQYFVIQYTFVRQTVLVHWFSFW